MATLNLKPVVTWVLKPLGISFTVDDIRFYNFDEPTPDKASVDLSTLPTKKELPPRRCVASDPCYGSNAFDYGAVTSRMSSGTTVRDERHLHGNTKQQSGTLTVHSLAKAQINLLIILTKTSAKMTHPASTTWTAKHLIPLKYATVKEMEKNSNFIDSCSTMLDQNQWKEQWQSLKMKMVV